MAGPGFQKRGSPFFQVLFNTRMRGGGGGVARISIINPVGGGYSLPPPLKNKNKISDCLVALTFKPMTIHVLYRICIP